VRWDFQEGDVGYVQKNLLHCVENIGDTDLVFLEMFKADRFQDFSFLEWLAHTPRSWSWRIWISTKRPSMQYQEKRRW
jgi:oxalate decarboxylase/phosphoglucose isomerase-like protein (cupin superfamily)